MILKRHANKNKYTLTEDGLWVRDMTAKSVPLVDINNLISESEVSEILANELENRSRHYQDFESEISRERPNVVVLSDGFKFEEKHRILSKLPSDVSIF